MSITKSHGDRKDIGLDKSTILLTMKNQERKNTWINTGRDATLLSTAVDPFLKEERIHIREVLTSSITKKNGMQNRS